MIRELGQVCHFYSGTGFPIAYQGKDNGELPFYKVGDIAANVTAGNKYLSFCSNYITKEEALELRGTIIPQNTVVFAKIGEALKLNRRAITSCDCLIDNNAMGIAPKEDILRTDYFFYYMKQLRMQDHSESTTVPSVRKSKLEQIGINVPSLEEQKIVEERLNLLSGIILKREQELLRLDDLIKARFVEMFGEDRNPSVKLMDLIIDGAGLSYGIVQPGDDGTGDMGVLRPVDMVDGKISLNSIKYIDRSIGDGYKRTELTGEELLITVRGTTGITALTDVRFRGMNVTRGIAVIRFDSSKINPVYLNTYLNASESQRYIQEHTRGATLQQINLSDLRELEITIPPMDLQEQFALFAIQVDKSKAAVKKSIDENQKLFDSLMQQYFG